MTLPSVNINSTTNGLPGIAVLKKIVGALMTFRLIPAAVGARSQPSRGRSPHCPPTSHRLSHPCPMVTHRRRSPDSARDRPAPTKGNPMTLPSMDINPNTNGLPSNAALEKIVGALMRFGLNAAVPVSRRQSSPGRSAHTPPTSCRSFASA
jgi:hypothetical protein